MKRHPHRSAKIHIGDRVYASTDILAHGPPVPLGATGKVLKVKGKVVDVQFDGHGIAKVARGQVRPIDPNREAILKAAQGIADDVAEEALESFDRCQVQTASPQEIQEHMEQFMELPPPQPEPEPGTAAEYNPDDNRHPVPEATPTAPPEPAPTITINGVEVPAMIVTTGKDGEP